MQTYTKYTTHHDESQLVVSVEPTNQKVGTFWLMQQIRQLLVAQQEIVEQFSTDRDEEL